MRIALQGGIEEAIVILSAADIHRILAHYSPTTRLQNCLWKAVLFSFSHVNLVLPNVYGNWLACTRPHFIQRRPLA
jgi:hypothetical protein